MAGLVADLDGLEGFLHGRLATAGLASAGLAAAACGHAAEVAAGAPAAWAGLDAEAAARTPSPAQRRAARVQGRALLRAARAAWPHPVLESLADGSGLAADPAAGGPPAPCHPVVLGACAWITGGTPSDAALLAATSAITSPASAAIRLLGLDPLAVTGLLARLGPDAAAVAARAASAAERCTGRRDRRRPGTGRRRHRARPHRDTQPVGGPARAGLARTGPAGPAARTGRGGSL